MANGGPEIEQLIQLLARLPGLGPRSARRAVLHLIKKKEALMVPLSAALDRAVDAVKVCEVCGNIDTRSPCGICADPRRAESGLLIVVEDVADLWALERAGVGAVRYHVLGVSVAMTVLHPGATGPARRAREKGDRPHCHQPGFALGPFPGTREQLPGGT